MFPFPLPKLMRIRLTNPIICLSFSPCLSLAAPDALPRLVARTQQHMAILFVLFVVQFSMAAASLSFTEDQEVEVARNGWTEASNSTILKAEKYFYCCGFDKASEYCEFKCCMKSAECRCKPCVNAIRDTIDSSLSLSGTLALLFSFTEFLGVWLTIRYRNQRDPRLDPSTYL